MASTRARVDRLQASLPGPWYINTVTELALYYYKLEHGQDVGAVVFGPIVEEMARLEAEDEQ